MEALFPLLILAALGGAFYWLHQKNAADLQKLGEALGLAVIPKGVEEEGSHALGGRRFHQTLVLSGELEGQPVMVYHRVERRGSKSRNSFTVLVLELPRASEVKLLVAPATHAALLSLLGGKTQALKTGDEEFDRLFFSQGEPEDRARRVLDEGMRKLLLAFRGGVAPGMPSHLLGRFSGDLLTGTFELEANRVSYAFSGTPMPAMAERLQMAGRLLTELAKRLGTD